MAEIKDKITTVESLNAVHEYNENTYVKKADIIPVDKGGTGADNGADGLKNLFASGNTVLSAYQYGDQLPEPGVVGRIFFKKLVE